MADGFLTGVDENLIVFEWTFVSLPSGQSVLFIFACANVVPRLLPRVLVAPIALILASARGQMQLGQHVMHGRSRRTVQEGQAVKSKGAIRLSTA